MKVSIIIPTKNRFSFLKQAILSVKKQTYKNIEIIVVDDGSDEDIYDYLQDFQSIQIIKNKTGIYGPSKTRNLGIENAVGDYILFLDDDDLIHPEHIQNLITKSKGLPENYILSSAWLPFSYEKNILTLGKDRRFLGEKDKISSIRDMIDPQIQDNIWTSSLLFPITVFNHIKWDENLFTNGDIDFFGRVILNGFIIYGVASDMGYYRSHKNERVAGTPSKKGLISSSKHKIKWSGLLFEYYQDNSKIIQAMQKSIMFLLLTWSNSSYKEKSEWINTLKSEFKKWHGKKYFLPLHSNKKKKKIAEIMLNLFGLSTWPILCNLNNKTTNSQLQSHQNNLTKNELNSHKEILLSLLQGK